MGRSELDKIKPSTSVQTVTLNTLHGTTSSSSKSSNYYDSAIRSLNRADVVKTKRDETGWREPTSYYANGKTKVHCQGSVSLRTVAYRTYYNRPYQVITDTSHSGVLNYGGYSFRNTADLSVLPAESVSLPSIFEEFENRSIIGARNAIADRKAAFGETLAELIPGLQDLGGFMSKNATILKGIVSRNPRQVLRAFTSDGRIPSKGQRRDVKRIIGNKTRNSSQHLAESLLAVEWGLQPMIEDAHLLALNIEGKLLGGGLRVNGRSTVYSPIEGEGPGRTINTQPAILATRTSRFGRKGVTTSLWYTIDSVGIRTLTQLGLTDVPQVVWAVQPGSFLVDWVIPVSTWLKSLSATHGLTYRGGTSTAFHRYTDLTVPVKGFAAGSTGPQYDEYDFTEFSATPEVIKRFAMSRKVHVSEPMGSPYIRDPFGAYQAVMSAAMLGAQIKSLPR